MISYKPPFAPFAQLTLTRALTEGQIQMLLQFLYSDRAETRCEAIEQIITHEWHDARVMQALEELAGLDEVGRVREMAEAAIKKWRCKNRVFDKGAKHEIHS